MIKAIPGDLQNSIKSYLESFFKSDIKLKDFKFSSGGCINKTGILKTSKGDYFIKWNTKKLFPNMFKRELMGLNLLISAKHNLKVPKPILAGEDKDHIFLILENIIPAHPSFNFWENLGHGLAELHQNSNEQYGLDYNNYIGSLNQVNAESSDWLEFFRKNRIEFTFKMAYDSGFFSKSDRIQLDNMFKHLNQICPENIRPSLIHGDLWSGNLMVDSEGNPCLIDPAVYYGFREIEIAFTELFGGYDTVFYGSYNEHWALEEGYSERKDIWNLYPLLVHVNLFGYSYATTVKSILARFR
ncbi:fructosamine kinase family protein [Hyphobacterium sp. CCMP332]|nr:fructosamine kinase family protein [Hyphobacterium sp. CCMP332]